MPITQSPSETRPVTRRRRLAGDRGEGVISTAIAVLIMAFLGAAMWVIFRNILTDSGSKTETQIDQIGGG